MCTTATQLLQALQTRVQLGCITDQMCEELTGLSHRVAEHRVLLQEVRQQQHCGATEAWMGAEEE